MGVPMGTKPCDFFYFRKVLWTNRKRWERVAWWRVKWKENCKKPYINGGSVSFSDCADAGRFPECFRTQVSVAGRSDKGRSIQLHNYPPVSLRGHTYRLLQGPSRLRRRSSAFSVRVVKYWNRLPAHLVLAPSVSIFKKQLERHWFEIFPAAPV